MINTAQFNRDLKKFAASTGEAVDTVMRGVTLDLYGRVIDNTPVDSGRLKGNWQLSTGSPATAVLDRIYTAGQEAREAGNLSPMKAPRYFMSNNLPYAEVVEFGLFPDGPMTTGGYSRKAPHGMVRIVMEEAERALRAQVDKL